MTTAPPRITPTYGYYRQPNGWITVSPATELEEMAYRREGWQPLTRYGRVEMTTEYMAEHPFEVLFMKGGAKELPVEQVIEMGFTVTPPVVPACNTRIDQFHKHHGASCWEDAQPVVFPQLEGVLIMSFACPICNRILPSAKARDQHEGVAHRSEKSDIRTGQTLADALVQGLRGVAATPAPTPNTPEANGGTLAELERVRAELAALKARKPRRRRAVPA